MGRVNSFYKSREENGGMSREVGIPDTLLHYGVVGNFGEVCFVFLANWKFCRKSPFANIIISCTVMLHGSAHSCQI